MNEIQKPIKIGNKEFTKIITEDMISDAAWNISEIIENIFKGQDLVLIGVAEGGLKWLDKLDRRIRIPFREYVIKASSYKGNIESGELSLEIPEMKIKGAHCLIVDDIYDSGRTMEDISEKLRNLGAKSVRYCPMCTKKPTPRILKAGFRIDPDYFLVGMGMDYMGEGRDLKDIYRMIE